MIDLAIFDLDGTLVDTPSGIVQAFAATFAELGDVDPSDRAIRRTIGMPLAVAFRSLLGTGTAESDIDNHIATYQQKFAELVLPKAESLVYPGVTDGLDRLKASGVPLAIATSKFHANANALLSAAKLDSRFSLIVGADEVDRPKPSPDMGEFVLRTMNIHPGRAVMVGDTTHDILMARAVGIRSIAVTYGVHDRQELIASKPTWIADDFLSATRILTTVTVGA